MQQIPVYRTDLTTDHSNKGLRVGASAFNIPVSYSVIQKDEVLVIQFSYPAGPEKKRKAFKREKNVKVYRGRKSNRILEVQIYSKYLWASSSPADRYYILSALASFKYMNAWNEYIVRQILDRILTAQEQLASAQLND